MHLRTAVPSVLNDLLTFKFPPNAYHFVPRERILRPTISKPSSLSGPIKFRRSSGEAVPCFPLTSASHDPSLIHRIGQGFKRGLQRTRTGLDAPLSEYVNFWFDNFLEWRPLHLYEWDDSNTKSHLLDLVHGVVRSTISRLADRNLSIQEKPSLHKYLGQDGLSSLNVTPEPWVDEDDFVNTVVFEISTVGNLESIRENPSGSQKPKLWLGFGSGDAIDLRLLDSNGRSVMHPEGEEFKLAKMALQLYENKARFGLLYAPPYFALCELVVEDGRTHLLTSELCSSALWPDDDLTTAMAPRTETFFATLLSLFLNFHEDYLIDGPTEEMRLALRRNAEKLERLFLLDKKASVSLRHVPGTAIICDSETNKDMGMLAIGVELHYDGDLFSPSFYEEEVELLPWVRMSSEDDARLDRLDLVTEVGTGRTAKAWTARWSRRPEAAVVSAEFAMSIAREYFIYTQVVPSLSPAAQAYFPNFHGLYRSGSDGCAYILVLEDIGRTVTDEEWESDTELKRKINDEFKAIANEGVYHGDGSPPNVAIRPDGRICIIDWGEASFVRRT
ncbi:BQ2448_2119 [Microbotryum intermedium]|uniref:BQ2448_2119 protein n=1 Tax=Microbotryum intermedium TaxID=269621 RepID=A0A238F8K8_9BASI|nr:BQ2448_2119 [Microbotryum intermedium]